MDVPAPPDAELEDPLDARESYRTYLEHQLGHLIAEVRLPEDNKDKDVEEARRRLLGIWPSITGNWSRLSELGRELGETRNRRNKTPGWNVFVNRRLYLDEARLTEEQSQYRTRFSGLFESVLDNYAILMAGGAQVLFAEPEG